MSGKNGLHCSTRKLLREMELLNILIMVMHTYVKVHESCGLQKYGTYSMSVISKAFFFLMFVENPRL